MNNVTFLIAVESYIIRKGLVAILKNLSGTEVSLETENPDAFRNHLKEHVPDFIILSVPLMEKLSRLYSETPELKEKTILIAQNEAARTYSSYNYILLDVTKQEILMQLEQLINPHLNRKKQHRSSILSEREITILRHVAAGQTNKQIADSLFLSLHTVTTHRKNIGNKLGIKSVSGLTVYAIVNDIISIEDISNPLSS